MAAQLHDEGLKELVGEGTVWGPRRQHRHDGSGDLRPSGTTPLPVAYDSAGDTTARERFFGVGGGTTRERFFGVGHSGFFGSDVGLLDEGGMDMLKQEEKAEPYEDVAPPTPPVEELEAAKLLREAHEEVALPPVEEEPLLPCEERGFVVSISKLGWKRLHYLGGCSRVPGVHYLTYELLGEAPPAPDLYDDTCRQCWGLKGKAPSLEVPSELPGEISPETSEAEEA